MSVTETAKHLFDWGIMPIPLRKETKDPNRKRWQMERYLPGNVAHDFKDGEGVGARWGHLLSNDGATVLTNNTVDVDLDTPEAIRIAPLYLPDTGMKWGRASKPCSHWIYRLPTLDIKTAKAWSDMTPPAAMDNTVAQKWKGNKLLELRMCGHTVAPGSVNVSSGRPEMVRWEPDGFGPPTVVQPDDLVPVLPIIAAAALVARHWRDGDRHDTALPLAGFLWHGGMALTQAERFMQAVCIGAEDNELDKRLDDVRDTYRNAMSGTFVTGGRTLEDHLPPIAVTSIRKWLGLKAKQFVGILGPDGYPLASDGDGERFAARWVGEVLYCAEEKQWYVWDGKRWARDRVLEVKERAKIVVADFRKVVGEKSALCGRDGIAPYRECAAYSAEMGNEGRLNAMLKAAASKPEIRITPEEFDANPQLFNTQNCTLELDITTGRVQQHLHEPADRIRSIANASFNPDATHPLVDQYRQRFFPEDDRYTFLEESAGYALTGLPKRHSVQMIGPHDAGKSTTHKLFGVTWGEYAASLSATSLAKNPHKGGDVARPDLWRVKGKRLVTVGEVGPDTRIDVELFKTITSGGDTQSLRTFFDATGGIDVAFAFALWMSGNKPYGPPAGEQAAFDRLDVLDCEHVIPGSNRDATEERELYELEECRDAVLALAVRGFTRLYGENHGELTAPESSQKRKQALIRELDSWADIVDLLVEFTGDANDGVLKSEVWACAKTEFELDGGRVRNVGRTKSEVEDSLTRRGARLTTARTRFNNRDYWQGVKWTAHAALNHSPVTMPEWHQQQESGV